MSGFIIPVTGSFVMVILQGGHKVTRQSKKSAFLQKLDFFQNSKRTWLEKVGGFFSKTFQIEFRRDSPLYPRAYLRTLKAPSKNELFSNFVLLDCGADDCSRHMFRGYELT